MARGSVYQQTKHRQWRGGMHTAKRASLCFNCRRVTPHEELFKGWCQSCIASWKSTTDVALIDRARIEHAAARAVPEIANLDRLKERILAPKTDADFLPLTRFRGAVTVGQQQTWWNVLQMMYVLEIGTTSELFKLAEKSHDTLHLCGRHSPIQRQSLTGFLSRINSLDVFGPWDNAERSFRDYVRGFVRDNRMLIFRYDQLTSGDAKQRRERRTASEAAKDKRRRQRAYQNELKAIESQPRSAFWPFAPCDADEQGELLHAIDAAVPRYLPAAIREDVCQDFVVAVLSGDCTLDEIEGSLPKFIKRVFKAHPIKYGTLSLDRPAPWMHDTDRTLGDVISETEFIPRHADTTDYSHIPDDWHEGRNRPVGVSSIGEVLRAKHDGVAVPDLVVPEDEVPDTDLVEVYRAEVRPVSYRRPRR